MAEMRSESEQYRAENAELRHELQAVHSLGVSAATQVEIRTRRRLVRR